MVSGWTDHRPIFGDLWEWYGGFHSHGGTPNHRKTMGKPKEHLRMGWWLGVPLWRNGNLHIKCNILGHISMWVGRDIYWILEIRYCKYGKDDWWDVWWTIYHILVSFDGVIYQIVWWRDFEQKKWDLGLWVSLNSTKYLKLQWLTRIVLGVRVEGLGIFLCFLSSQNIVVPMINEDLSLFAVWMWDQMTNSRVDIICPVGWRNRKIVPSPAGVPVKSPRRFSTISSCTNMVVS